MEKTPLVSVIMAAKNEGKHIRRSVASILSQTYENIELIVVDDGSEDATKAILLYLASRDARLFVLCNTKAAGTANALNRAWLATRGKYVAIMDADDFAFAGRLEAQVRYLERHPETDILGTQAYSMHERTGAIELDQAAIPGTKDAFLAFLFRYVPFAHPSIMMKRSVFGVTGMYDPAQRRSQDRDFYFRAVLSGCTLAKLPEPYVVYRRWDTKLSRVLVYCQVRCVLVNGFRSGMMATALRRAAQLLHGHSRTWLRRTLANRSPRQTG